MAEKLNLFQKLEEIRKQTEVIQKTKEGYGYKYTGIEDILAHITVGMDKYHVSLVPSFMDGGNVAPYTYNKVKVTRNGERYEEPVTEYLANANITYTWINNENPTETLAVPWVTAGSQSDPSQAMGSALTYSLRYFLTQFFQIACPEDDPDNWRSKQKAAEEQEARATAQKICDDINTYVKALIEKDESVKAPVIEISQKYCAEDGQKAGSKNYMNIKNPIVASKMLEEIKAKWPM